MTRDRLVTVFVTLAALTVAVVVTWIVFFRHPVRTVERVKGSTVVLVAPPATPLPRDSGPRNNGRRVSSSAKKKSNTTNQVRVRPGAKSSPQAKNRPLPIRAHKTPRPKAKRPASPQPPAQPSQPANPPPAPRPPVDVQIPAPVTVCVRPAGGLNCQ